MLPSSRPVSKAAAKRVTRSQSKCRSILNSDKRLVQEAACSKECVSAKRVTRSQLKSILISDKRTWQEVAYSEEIVDSTSTEECNWLGQYKSRKQYNDAQQWNARFQEIKLYQAKHGHCNVPRRSGKLGTWVDKQRVQYRLLLDGRQSSMADERIQKLESIGFQWS
eukprot:CAMPEP_0116014752 /NCGR_PEP_ID=MMETSP0321-20121206/6442_1 /TAXON_ID=163516 /ORGANISM="Leptocylindrus danicus var. danicus, Strain B650" /LENGTH=165 /DNA_ID=CAMNT_0003484419 /DNA_START=337 /DNA_END=831 /DNA_ORIENTATION=-